MGCGLRAELPLTIAHEEQSFEVAVRCGFRSGCSMRPSEPLKQHRLRWQRHDPPSLFQRAFPRCRMRKRVSRFALVMYRAEPGILRRARLGASRACGSLAPNAFGCALRVPRSGSTKGCLEKNQGVVLPFDSSPDSPGRGHPIPYRVPLRSPGFKNKGAICAEALMKQLS